MSDYASNCPISRPRKVDWTISWDLGGMAWSYEWGFFYQTGDGDGDSFAPLRRPTPPMGE